MENKSDLYLHDLELHKKGLQPLVGIDEAGRGPLAGPVVAAAVVLPLDGDYNYVQINDSKQLNSEIREELAGEIKEMAVDWAVGIVSPEEIDSRNIYQATLLAMHKAIEKIRVKSGLVLIDGNTNHPALPRERQRCIVKGDATSLHIAAASIIAKVTRDRLVSEYDRMYPGFSFSQHKGYATRQHFQALKDFGPTPIHRFSFSPVWESFLAHYRDRLDLSRLLTGQLSLLAEDTDISFDYGHNIEYARQAVEEFWSMREKMSGS